MQDHAEILASLPLRPRPGLYLEPSHGQTRVAFLILEGASDPGDGDGIIGLAVPGENGGWYLGCIGCSGEITEEDSGMCQSCRRNAELDDLSARDGYEPYDDDPDGWDRNGVVSASGTVYSDAGPGL